MTVLLDTSVLVPTLAVAAKFCTIERLKTFAEQRAFEAEQRAQRVEDNLVRAAHEEANSRNLCSDFDDFMEAIGLPRRTRNYRIDLSVTLPVSVIVEAQDAEDAENELDHDDVCQALREAARYSSGDVEWSVENVDAEDS